jgi:hypothetical protein
LLLVILKFEVSMNTVSKYDVLVAEVRAGKFAGKFDELTAAARAHYGAAQWDATHAAIEAALTPLPLSLERSLKPLA